MATTTLPATIGDITPTWLSGVLREQDGTGDATVTEVEVHDIGTGVGFVGEIARLRLTWDRVDPSLPTSVVAKVPTRVTRNRALAEALLAYEREHRVYTELGETGARMPHVHAAALDPNPLTWLGPVLKWVFDHLPVRALMAIQPALMWLCGRSTRRYVLLLEDVDDARPPSQVVGGDVEQVRLGLGLLAGLHASRWDDPTLADHADWLWPLDRTPRAVQAAYARGRAAFAEAAPDAVDSGLLAELDRVQEEYPQLVGSLMAGPVTLLHGDFRLDNLLFRPDGDVVLLDWQLAGVGHPAWDVGYFLVGALDPVRGRAHETALVAHYLSELAGRGVDAPDAASFTEAVELVKRLVAHRMVFAEEILDTDLGDGTSFVDLMVARLRGWLAEAA